jgi:hypothetical protein
MHQRTLTRGSSPTTSSTRSGAGRHRGTASSRRAVRRNRKQNPWTPTAILTLSFRSLVSPCWHQMSRSTSPRLIAVARPARRTLTDTPSSNANSLAAITTSGQKRTTHLSHPMADVSYRKWFLGSVLCLRIIRVFVITTLANLFAGSNAG